MTSYQALQDRFGRNVVHDLRVRLDDTADPLAALLAAVGATGARLGELRLIAHERGRLLYDVQVFSRDDAQALAARDAAGGIEGVEVVAMRDPAMETHRGGACEMRGRTPIRSNTDLRIVYTPGVARVCRAIQDDPAAARAYTNLANKVAIVTNGTAILGLGDIGPLAGLPVMEGKSAIFWEFAGLSAEPILIDSHDADEIIETVVRIAPTFGAIQVEDIKAPECFRVTRELDRRLAMPVMHDDQYGTATIVLAGLYAALARTGRDIGEMTCAISGAGAAGTAIADLLLKAGVDDVVLCDSAGIIHRGRTERMNDAKRDLAEWTNKQNLSGTLADAMGGRTLFVGVSQPDIVSQDMVRSMAPEPIVFALANPVSEIARDDALAAGASIYADGRMMNNALAYPGIFRGALDAAAEAITERMMRAAAGALANLVPDGELMPEMMDRATHRAVADAVRAAAIS
ncbi:MAG: NADP-dependent malic enzyme [Phycisphaerae bacterium]|nr:NADP-dependent malic enzyme [Phycisphaerae bacterium]